jgi:hypothetical protein
MQRRGYKRFTKRLVGEFSFRKRAFKGISSNISERGLFLKTNNCLAPDSAINLTVHLSDGKNALVKGVVRWAVKSNSPLIKNGMGIEVLDYDNAYHEFLKEHIEDFKAPPLLNNKQEEKKQPDFEILKCGNCGVKNKVRIERLSFGPKCGKCKESLVGG